MFDNTIRIIKNKTYTEILDTIRELRVKNGRLNLKLKDAEEVIKFYHSLSGNKGKAGKYLEKYKE